MALYLYETTDPNQPVEQFEIRQSMLENALETHPETGAPIRRVISGGFGFSIRGGVQQPSSHRPSAHSCGSGCACC